MQQLSIFDCLNDNNVAVGSRLVDEDLNYYTVDDISDNYIRSVGDDGSIHLTPKLYFKYFFKVV